MADSRAGVVEGADSPAERSLRLFVSGHSLTDRPIPDDLAQIAASLGRTVEWNRQHVAGSTIMQRAQGLATGGAAGVDRDGRPVDVARTFGGDADGRPYDVLLITEQHALLSALLWNDTVGQLARFHDAFIASNPHGATFFFEPWMSLDDRSDPSVWIAYEKAAAPVWRCVVAGVNRSLAELGRPDRVATIPAALALAELVEAAPQGGFPGARTQAEAVELLIADDVHPTRLGAYFIALVTYAGLERRSPEGAWAPPGVRADQTAGLQRFAGQIAKRESERPTDLDLDACGARIATAFASEFWTYFERARWRKELGPVASRLRLAQETWRGRLRTWRGAENPFLIRDADLAERGRTPR